MAEVRVDTTNTNVVEQVATSVDDLRRDWKVTVLRDGIEVIFDVFL